MSQLVLNNLGDTLLGGSTAGLLVEKQVDHTVGDEAPVLHGALGKVGNGHLVHLGEGELDAKNLFVEFQGSNGKVQRESAMLNVLAWRGIDTDRDTELCGLDIV